MVAHASCSSSRPLRRQPLGGDDAVPRARGILSKLTVSSGSVAALSYAKQQLHKAGYSGKLLATNSDMAEGLRSLLRLCRETVVRLQ
jgi:hypothetical protein